MNVFQFMLSLTPAALRQNKYKRDAKEAGLLSLDNIFKLSSKEQQKLASEWSTNSRLSVVIPMSTDTVDLENYTLNKTNCEIFSNTNFHGGLIVEEEDFQSVMDYYNETKDSEPENSVINCNHSPYPEDSIGMYDNLKADAKAGKLFADPSITESWNRKWQDQCDACKMSGGAVQLGWSVELAGDGISFIDKDGETMVRLIKPKMVGLATTLIPSAPSTLNKLSMEDDNQVQPVTPTQEVSPVENTEPQAPTATNEAPKEEAAAPETVQPEEGVQVEGEPKSDDQTTNPDSAAKPVQMSLAQAGELEIYDCVIDSENQMWTVVDIIMDTSFRYQDIVCTETDPVALLFDTSWENWPTETMGLHKFANFSTLTKVEEPNPTQLSRSVASLAKLSSLKSNVLSNLESQTPTNIFNLEAVKAEIRAELSQEFKLQIDEIKNNFDNQVTKLNNEHQEALDLVIQALQKNASNLDAQQKSLSAIAKQGQPKELRSL